MKALSGRNLKGTAGQRKPAEADQLARTPVSTVESVNASVKISAGVTLRVHAADPETSDPVNWEVLELEIERRKKDLFAVSLGYFTWTDRSKALAGDGDQNITLYLNEPSLRALPAFFARLLEVAERSGLLAHEFDGRWFAGVPDSASLSVRGGR